MSVIVAGDGIRALSMDGPALLGAALSELYFLRHIAHRWAFKDEEEGGIAGDDVRVSEMFDIIGGCGLGGLYAILFARLNMTIGQVIRFHDTLQEELFTADCWARKDSKECTRAFDNALDHMVSDYGAAVELSSSLLSKDCKKCVLMVLNEATPSSQLVRTLRSYHTRLSPCPDCTIRQALHATIADLIHLPAVLIDGETFFGCSVNISSPSRLLLKELSSSFPKSHLACFVSLGANFTYPPNDSHMISQEMISQFQGLECFFRMSVRAELNAESKIKSMVFGYLQEEDVSVMIDELVEALKGRPQTVQLLRLGKFAEEMVEIKYKLDCRIFEMKEVLEKIRASFDFRSVNEQGCLKGTREDVFQNIETWAEDPDAPNVFWLEGYPGTGKTAVSISLKQRLSSAHRLGAACFFRREDASHHALETLFRSIASQLANHHSFVKDSIVQAVNSGCVRFEDTPSSVFQELIYGPLAVACKDFNDYVVIIIDAMDEFGKSELDQRRLLEVLLPKWIQLPKCCKLFITSRRQGDLSQILDRPEHRVQSLAVGEAATEQTINDIRSFFEHGFDALHKRTIVTAPQLNILVDLSSGLFIWASTVIEIVRKIKMRNLTKQFVQDLCSQKPKADQPRLQSLYRLYHTVVQPLLDSGLPSIYHAPSVKQTFFSAVVCARVPLTADTLSLLCMVEVDDIEDLVQELSPVMDSSCGLRFVHKSFVDYVVSEDFPLQLDLVGIEHAFMLSSLRIMRMQLHFNMGNMPSSNLLNSEVPGLGETLSEELRYASHFWGSHFVRIDTWSRHTVEVATQSFREFFDHQFLYWVETVSILGHFREALKALSKLTVVILQEELSHFAHDALDFLRQFATPISESYPHIYVSAVPCTPTSSLIWKIYNNNVQHVLKILSHGDTDWPPQIAVIRGHTHPNIAAVAFSPDGSQIVSGSEDMTVRVWDATTYQAIGEPLQYQGYCMRSLAFSPDGSQIIGVTGEPAVLTWDSTTRQCVMTSIPSRDIPGWSTGISPDGSKFLHASDNDSYYGLAGMDDGGIKCFVTFSPDDSKIASVSFSGKTIQIWDATTRQPSGELRGHTDTVNCLAFSPNGSQIVSGAGDRALRIWDVSTCQPVGVPIRGHSDSVYSVAFSPDGSQVVSGGSDGTVRIWNAAVVPKYLPSHSSQVESVAFSSNGSRIASGSDDKTIRIWDAVTFQPIGEPLEGHKQAVTAVSFSHDGSQIVSGSRDCTVRIWDAFTYQPVGEPLQWHDHTVLFIEFSLDDCRIIGGSSRGNIRMWDVATHQQFGMPWEDRIRVVEYVSFPPEGGSILNFLSKPDQPVCTTDPDIVGMYIFDYDRDTSAIAVSPDGSQIVSGSCDNTVRIWDAASGHSVGRPLRGHKGSVRCVAFSSDGTLIVSGSCDESFTIRIWNVDTGTCVGMLPDHDSGILSVAFSPDGSQVVTGSLDNTVRIWDLATFQPSLRDDDDVSIISGSINRAWPGATTRSQVDQPKRTQKSIILSNSSNPLAATYSLLRDGWVINQNSQRLLWIPHHLHMFLPTPGLVGILGSRGMIEFDVSDMRTGTNWLEIPCDTKERRSN